ncbi:unnamed protein product [Vitrella brassicaformis CCMP3155]|uniref:Sugar phosphate transporter domain-containing protein n=1 Tax=Vitrella brassicaformis (strain CCMP3155) TaxID=1169540 RepID=A0A0G4H7T4_VITBC|nr:unnamed protein product [Vitrella brassicaformis CCMP3155]|mmetsp:Transcript_32669/g.80899  ORF Transcript_32669/g.80899 Transcript_32669/m.80899 type:complete len:419 (-) Transcript_32669:392-1648(-)|eukprot:CEM39824.1 unnamed protein product [Vitrella brassicaformis CCMP3155]
MTGTPRPFSSVLGAGKDQRERDLESNQCSESTPLVRQKHNRDGSLLHFDAVLACLTYLFISAGITLFNKAVMSLFNFKLFEVILLCQTVFTVVAMMLFKRMGLLHYPPLTFARAMSLIPLTGFNLLRIIVGLGALAYLNVPTNSAMLRAGSICIIAGEYFFLSIGSSNRVIGAVLVQVVGAIVAAYNDLHFTAIGLVFGLFTCLFNCAYAIQMKIDLNHQAEINARRLKQWEESAVAVRPEHPPEKENIYSLLMYFSLNSTPVLLIWAILAGDLPRAMQHPAAILPSFQFCFLFTATLAAILNLSSFYATKLTSPLIVSVTSNIKNITCDVAGIFLFGDVTLTPFYLTGLIVSASGAGLFTYVKYIESEAHRKETERARRQQEEVAKVVQQHAYISAPPTTAPSTGSLASTRSSDQKV